MQFRNGKPERFALAFRSGLSLHLHGDKVEREHDGDRVCRNVKRWRNAAMALRWTAAGMMDAPQQVAAYGSGKGIMRRRCWIGRRYGLFPSV